MDGPRWTRLEELFERAQDHDGERRRRFLQEACGADTELRAELEAMLAAASADRALAVERLIVETPRLESPDPLIGTCLGRWRLVSVLGRGGMGTVYRGVRVDGPAQDVAVKVARAGPRDAHGRERFRTERRVLAHLRHPHIARLLAGGLATDGTPYFVMELVDGIPITTWCRNGGLPRLARLGLFRTVCDAVEHAHASLVVHRDLKPSNILVTVSGEVKLLDFGIAKLLDPLAWEIDASTTSEDLRILTPEYAAPEQRHGGPITTATDVYTLGIVLYELIAGTRPGAAGVAPLADRTSLGADLDRILLVALQEEPAQRYASAGRMGEQIGRLLDVRRVRTAPW